MIPADGRQRGCHACLPVGIGVLLCMQEKFFEKTIAISAEYVIINNACSKSSNNITFGPVAQLGAHYIRIVGVESSNLFRSTIERISEPFIVRGTVFVQTKRHSLP